MMLERIHRYNRGPPRRHPQEPTAGAGKNAKKENVLERIKCFNRRPRRPHVQQPIATVGKKM